VAKNCPKNSFQKASKAVDFQPENRPGQNPEFLVSPLCRILTRISAISRKGQKPNEKPIERRAVKSSNVVSVGFCPDRKCVEVEYKGGGVYRYHDCDQKLFDDLMKAKSIGKFVHKHLKPKKFTKL
jgi:KTSC domain